MSQAEVITTRPRGRPRGDEVRVAILRAANALLEEKGYAGFTIEGVAARCGAARTSIYRWWPSRGALAMAGFLAETAPKISYPQTDSAIADIREQMKRVARVYGGKVGRTIAAIVAEGQGDPETLRAFIHGYVKPRRADAKRVLQRGVDSGELRPDLDLEVVLDALYGPITYRMLVPHSPLTPAWAAALADHVFRDLRVETERQANSRLAPVKKTSHRSSPRKRGPSK
jgi:AcrR family transcriptional regulator